MADFPLDPWTVHIYEDGKHLGRLTPDGFTTRRKLLAAMMTQARAQNVADEINRGEGLEDGLETRKITARASKF